MPKRVKIIIPDWDDIVDPQFDFRSERHSHLYTLDRYMHGARIWHIFDPPPIDGVLLSRSMIEKERTKLKRLESLGVKKFLRLSSELEDRSRFQVIGDCGAWQYRHRDTPPYDPIETLNFYQRLGFDYGVSVDHIASIGNPRARMEITFTNALKSFEVWKRGYERGDYSFILLAAVQGVEVRDYIAMLEKLYSRGIRHFAIGGLASRTTEFIERLILSLYSFLRQARDIEKIHFLGIARPQIALQLDRLTDLVPDISFDNATYLRIAWARKLENYITLDGRAYTAIRIRGDSPKELQLLEKLREYDEGKASFDDVMKALREYVTRRGEQQYLPYYAKTLRDRPWKECDCPICRSIGIEVVVFRGNDRNRRRGFHNLYVFYKLLTSGDLSKVVSFKVMKDPSINVSRHPITEDITRIVEDLRRRGIDLKKSVSRVLIIASCSKKKNVDLNKVRRVLAEHGLNMPSFDTELEDVYRNVLAMFMKPAEEMYGGVFAKIRKIIQLLRSHGKHVDVYILSARYGLIEGATPIVPYDATLKHMKPSEIRNWAQKLGIAEKLKTVLSQDYDLILVVLAKEYAHAIKTLLPSLLNNPRAIIVTASSALPKHKPINATVLPGGTITQRIKALELLEQAFRHELSNHLDTIP